MYEKCYPIQNNLSKYICLCEENHQGKSCAQIDQQCINGFCSNTSICQPMYRGRENRFDLPYCICAEKRYGPRCYLEQHQCQSNPCFNGGQCFESSIPDRYTCVCGLLYKGDRCEYEKERIDLYIEHRMEHQPVVIQYLSIDYAHLKLHLEIQQIYEEFPKHLIAYSNHLIIPEIIVAKFYVGSQRRIHLLSLQINVTSANQTVNIHEHNSCSLIERQTTSPIQYHHLCRDNQSLLCFLDEYYLCFCDENHSHAECFQYDTTLDQCSFCLSMGQCLRGDPSDMDDFLCLCPACYSGRFCQFTSESFSFTLDQLFSTDLLSSNQFFRIGTITYLIMISSIYFLLGLMNNLCSFRTFIRVNCQKNGIGQYLLLMTITNQISLTLLLLRLVHLIINLTNNNFSSQLNSILCSLLNYLLVTSSRLTYWLVSFIAMERVYTSLVLTGHYWNKPLMARRLSCLIVILVCITGAYEVFFMKSHSEFEHNHSITLCILQFPFHHSAWKSIHRIVTIFHSIFPFIINLISVIIIVRVVLKKKMRLIGKRTICE